MIQFAVCLQAVLCNFAAIKRNDLLACSILIFWKIQKALIATCSHFVMKDLLAMFLQFCF